jgi:two-component system, OmpR family, sensor histidine kinase CiaH
MADKSKRRLLIATIIYWALLSYIVAALVWWFVSLEKQNRQMADLRISRLKESNQVAADPANYKLAASQIEDAFRRNQFKYFGEGATFLLLILIGAAFVYRSVRRQFRLQQQQRNFMMAVTHELKTPISVARLNLETIQKHQLDPEKQKKLLRMTLEEITRLNTLTNNILIASELEGGGYKFSKEDLDLSDLFKDRVHDFSSRFPDRKFIEEIQPDLDIKGDALLLQLLINNLIENAIRYSPKEKPILCKLKIDGPRIDLEIIDLGPGILENEKKNIFKKFYRVGNEATRKTQGTGLGLYLCLKISEDHHASITVKDNNPAGSRFLVSFRAENSFSTNEAAS